MGTASLVFGLILIGSGVFFSFAVLELIAFDEFEDWVYPVAFLMFPLPMLVVGGLLLRKYDKDKKKVE